MYLACKKVKQKTHYFIRESYRAGDHLYSRDMFDLGTDPEHYIVYPGGNAYYIDEVVTDRLCSFGVRPDSDELDDIFWRFLRPDIRTALDYFRRRRRVPSGRISEAEAEKIRTQVHLFDKRRIHYLKFGQIDQRGLWRTPSKLFHVLLEKSRDEIEQHFVEMEKSLQSSEWKTYVYVVFDLQRFFTETIANMMPQGLDQTKIDKHFLNEVCRLHSDPSFWAGINAESGFREYLTRYVIMYFDTEHWPGSFVEDYIRNFINRRRFYRTPSKKSSVNLEEASTILGVKKDALQKMSKRGLTRLYRHMAQKLHPDKGGDHEKFIQLTEAYQAILNHKK